MRIYISGLITNGGTMYPAVAAEYFKAMENALQEAGHVPVNPMEIAPFNPDHQWEDYMIKDIAALFPCDAIVLLENWHLSKGARIEHAIAQQMGIQIFYPYHHSHLLAKK